ncbi:MAG: hypothetical protein U9P79_00775 [Candidatus Cloacimonadota bacterium]|nr:hypothetical protein [Candidatus Cloacimonadota bacterium]
MKKYLLLLLIPILFACSRYIPFSSTIIQDYQLTEPEIKQLYFYLSDEIILERKANDEDTSVLEEKKSLKRVSVKSLDRIRFKQKTRGIPIHIQGNLIRVSFEPEEYLSFSTDEPHNKEGLYYLSVESYYEKGEMDEKRKMTIGKRIFHRRGILTYNGKKYNVYAPFPKPHLMVKEKKFEKDIQSKRTVKGIKNKDLPVK